MRKTGEVQPFFAPFDVNFFFEKLRNLLGRNLVGEFLVKSLRAKSFCGKTFVGEFLVKNFRGRITWKKFKGNNYSGEFLGGISIYLILCLRRGEMLYFF